jgi:hypothetical protein
MLIEHSTFAQGSDFVTNLLGVVTIGDPMILIMEAIANGDLQSYLHDDRNWAPGGEMLLQTTAHQNSLTSSHKLHLLRSLLASKSTCPST